MIYCHVSFPNPLTHLIHIELKFKVKKQGLVTLTLPAWRPGRYELAPFVENMQGFAVYDQDKNQLVWEKTRPNTWTVRTDEAKEIEVSYEYFAYKMDAGNSVLDDQQVYINFINCILSIEEYESSEISLKLDLPKEYISVCSLKKIESNLFLAKGYQELVDSPLLASPHLKLLKYDIDNYQFTIAMLGACPLEEDELLKDFKKFSRCQLSAMGGFPTSQYDFLIHSLDYKHYHGVEHQNSTVLVLGPNDSADKQEYHSKLMGVASHELFHTWNVTRIRPAEMCPYDFSQETMTKTGFVTEGFTTYFGDLFLKQSGVFDLNEYLQELNTLLKRHFENYGRHQASLIQSSQNLWVDGYKNLFPSKKVSIYVKGALCALIIDLKLRKATGNGSCLIDVIKLLFEKYTYDKGGYSMEQVYETISEIGGSDIPALLEVLYETTTSLDSLLVESLSYVGCKMIPQTHPDRLTSQWGLKLQASKISEIAPGSHIEQYLSVGDELISINGESPTTSNLPFNEINQVELKRGIRKLDLEIPLGNQTYYDSYKVELAENLTESQRDNLLLWLGNN